MRILMVIPELSVGGAELQFVRLAGLLAGRGHPVRILSVRPPRRPLDPPLDVEAKLLDLPHAHGVRFFLAMMREIRSFKPDVVYSVLFGFDLLANLAARFCKVPAIVSARRQLATWRTRRHRIYQDLGNLLVDAVVANSLAAADYCHATERCIDRGSIYVFPNAAPVSASVELDTPVPTGQGPCILNVANFWRGKGHESLLRAFAILKHEHPDARLWLVGAGDTLPAARALAEELGVAGSVEFLEGRSDVPAIMRHADLYVHASDMESSSNAVIEAMLSDLPVVAFACGGITELLDGGDLGTLVQPGNVAALASAISDALQDPEPGRVTAQAARAVARERHAPGRTLECYERLFSTLLDRKRAHPRAAEPKRVVMYTISDATTPSTRFRFLQFIPALQEHGLTVRHFALPRPRGGRYRRAGGLLLHAARRRWQLRKHSAFDALMIQKGLTLCRWKGPMRALRAMHRSFILDVDDSVLGATPVSFPAPFSSRQDDGEPRQLMELSSLVLAGNARLAEDARAHARSVSVLPTVIDCRRYGVIRAHPPVHGRDELCILWSGQSSTLPFLLERIDAIREAAQSLHPRAVVLRIVCDAFTGVDTEAHTPLRIECVRWSITREVDDLLGADVGVMPLPNNEWTRGKCGFKLLQYMALGLPVVGSPVGVNSQIIQDGKNGYLATSHEEWVSRLLDLLQSPKRRDAFGRVGRRTVSEEYSLGHCAETFVQTVIGRAQ
ncbi:MAG: glycosyltransferase [Verrucomicrobia bacterium]|nr:glycosyltransferase [Verrucomicrobiota bacterium]MDA1085407.1 glycosyltransferase [Verrucomicrobiota bacterium]